MLLYADSAVVAHEWKSHDQTSLIKGLIKILTSLICQADIITVSLIGEQGPIEKDTR